MAGLWTDSCTDPGRIWNPRRELKVPHPFGGNGVVQPTTSTAGNGGFEPPAPPEEIEWFDPPPASGGRGGSFIASYRSQTTGDAMHAHLD